MRWNKCLQSFFLPVLLFMATPHMATAASFVLVNLDDPDEGLNDSSPLLAVGGNSGTTLGEQREIALEYAMAMLSQVVSSNVTIKVQVDFDSLYCASNAATLATAGAVSWTGWNFPAGKPAGASLNTWYPYPLANALKGSDIFPNDNDISVTLNSGVDNNNNCLSNRNFYYGLDGEPGSDIDFITTVMHELVHGLGFQTLVDLASGDKGGSQNWNDVFMQNLQDYSLDDNWGNNSMSDADRATSATDTGDLLWTGAQTSNGLGGLSAGANLGYLSMYAPSTLSSGSSVNHIDTTASPDELMEPIQNGPKEKLGLATLMLQDIGWSTTTSNGPIISSANDLSIQNTLTASVDFAVMDNDTDVSALTLTAVSSAPAIIPQSGLTISGSGRSRNLNITPNVGTFGAVTLTVSVSDGNRIAQTDLVVNVLNNNAPIVTIVTSADDSVFYSAPQSLNGSASDDEDGDLSTGIQWTSSIDGNLGTGASLLPSLSDGAHTITASVTDSGNLSSDAVINVTVDLYGDEDGDGLANVTEISLGTNPLLADTDNDGLSDFEELSMDGNSSSYSAGLDADPNNQDTDGDGVIDGSDPDPLESTIGAYNVPMIPVHLLIPLALALIVVRRQTNRLH